MRLVLCLLAVSIFILSAAPLQMEVNGKSAILMNASTGRILFEKDAHLLAYPASTTKMATALFALEAKGSSLDLHAVVSQEALKMKPSKRDLHDYSFPAHWLESDGTSMGLQKGEKLPLDSLLYALILASANDAANVVGEALSGSIPQFVAEMNEYLQSIGCTKTYFTNPHGLHHPEHQTTAYDLALLMKRGLQNPKFREYIGKESVWIPATNRRASFELKHSNRLLKPGSHYYSKAIGGKTGYHSAALYTLAAAAEHQGRTLIAVTLGCAKSDDRYVDVKGMFEAAFNEVKIDRIVIPYSQVYVRSVDGAKNQLKASLSHDLYVSYYPSEEPILRGFVEWDSLVLPIAKGAKVGTIRAIDELGLIVAEGELLAQDTVDATFLYSLKQRLHRFIR